MTWIPISERMPPLGVRVLVSDGAHVCIADWSSEFYLGKWVDEVGREFWPRDFSHWQPLPEPPEGT